MRRIYRTLTSVCRLSSLITLPRPKTHINKYSDHNKINNLQIHNIRCNQTLNQEIKHRKANQKWREMTSSWRRIMLLVVQGCRATQQHMTVWA